MARAMTKLHALAPVLVMLAACNLMKKSGDAAEGGTTTDSTTLPAQTNAAPGVVAKALSFLGTGGPFEGEITMNMSSAGKPPETIVYMVKGQKMRFNAPSTVRSGAWVIFDGPAKKMTTVMDAQKMAMVVDLNGSLGGVAGADVSALGGKKPTIDKTGRTDTVAGYSCDVWKVTEDNGQKSDLCVADGISFPQMGKEGASWMGELGTGFPLRAVTTDAAAVEKRRMEVTRIDKKSIDDSQLTVPAGYKTQDMSGMLKALGGMPHH
jgi:hypothetical protein